MARVARPIAVLASALAALAVLGQAPERRPLDLYQWMATAPIVLEGRVLGEDGGRVEIQVGAVVRGTLPEGERVLVELRRANREREEERAALKLDRGASGLFLLEARASRSGKPATYGLVRGVDGFRALPAEGKDAWIDAARRLAAIQQTRNEDRIWAAMAAFLEDPNPILVDTALVNHLRFERGDTKTLEILRPLLSHPRPNLRRGSAELCASILRRLPSVASPEADAVLGVLISLATRDEDVTVRAAATRSLAYYPEDRTRTILETIARDDPDQGVRYEAERALYERRRRAAH